MKNLLLYGMALLWASGAIAADYDWSGLYLGAEAGGAFGRSEKSYSGKSTGNVAVDGLIGGSTVGYNLQWGSTVVGLEGDISADGGKGSSVCPNESAICHAGNHWLATVRPRLGYAFDNVLPYVTGGLAVGDIHSWHTENATGVTDADNTTVKTGWTVGVGTEISIDQNWSIKGEYLHVSLNNANNQAGATSAAEPTGTASSTTYDQTLSEDIIRVGLNYKF